MNFNQINFTKLRQIISERTTPCIFWIGAGLSINAGFPSWGELKQNILDDFRKEADEKDIETISQIAKEKDYWIAFSRIKLLLGNQKYNAYIRKYLDRREPPPEIYKKIWKLNPRGVITLNLDRLTVSSFTEVFHGKAINEFIGFDISDHLNLLRAPDPFIVNMHGTIDNHRSWVLTKEELKGLQRKGGYSTFISSIFTNNVVVFIGISAEDMAAGGTLNNLVQELDLNLDVHYWITDRKDHETIEWAERTNIGIINYCEGKHEELIDILENIENFTARDLEMNPVVSSITNKEKVNASDINTLSPNDLRYFLNIKIREYMSSDTDYEKYFEFIDRYDELIHRAWYIGKTPETKVVFEYKLNDLIGKGGFGKVYKAFDKSEELVAVKIIHEDIREEKDKLMCFRRGVKALSILGTRSMSNIVKLIAATEIPLMIVMEYIDGPNLSEFVEAGYCVDWNTILSISKSISDVLLKAHNLPERVLHRDLRPTNIMLKQFYQNGTINVVLTDFDFSWYKGAKENSISRTPAGFLAPEQIDSIDGASTRSALIDSYGFGMNLFFIISKKTPLFKNHKHHDWPTTVLNACTALKCKAWVTIPLRMFRLIMNLTKDIQRERWDVSQADQELERLEYALENGQSTFAELIAEELMARSLSSYDYECEEFGFVHKFINGLQYRLEFSEVNKRVIFCLCYQDRKSTRLNSSH